MNYKNTIFSLSKKNNFGIVKTIKRFRKGIENKNYLVATSKGKYLFRFL